MDTVVIPAFDASGELQEQNVAAAAELLKAGELVAFPTETVYGLGAKALDEKAVARIFEAKGRPTYNPLIVHVSSLAEARALVKDWPAEAQLLAEAFWPGPLTLILKKIAHVPDIVTGGGDTVAIRVPSHPVALELLKKCGFPLAAPSANMSNQLSPTSAEHVLRGMRGRIRMILDGGRCEAGIESTVLNLTSGQPIILRPGVLPANFLSEVMGKEVHLGSGTVGTESGALLSPGRMQSHYAPLTPLLLVPEAEILDAVKEAVGDKKRVAAITLRHPECEHPCKDVLHIRMPSSPEGYARDLYAVLHHLDQELRDVIICELPPEELTWAGVRDRLLRGGKLYKK